MFYLLRGLFCVYSTMTMRNSTKPTIAQNLGLASEWIREARPESRRRAKGTMTQPLSGLRLQKP